MSIKIKEYHVRTSPLPTDVRREAVAVAEDLLNGKKSPEDLGGKRFTEFKYLASIPLRKNYRLVLKRRPSKEWAPLAIHSHETYNKEDYRNKSIRIVRKGKRKNGGSRVTNNTGTNNKQHRSQRINEWHLNGKPLWINNKLVPVSTFTNRYDLPYHSVYDAVRNNRLLGDKEGGRWMLCKSEELIQWLQDYRPKKAKRPELVPPPSQEPEKEPEPEPEPATRSLLEEANRLWLKAARLQAEADNLRYEAQRLRRLYEREEE